MLDLIRKIRKPKYESLNRIEIVKQNLIDNYNYLKSLQAQAKIWPVLKSNAYGHGLKEVCQILNETDAEMVAIDSFPEAQIVYKYFNGKALILSEMPNDVYKHCKFKKTEFCVYNLEKLKFLAGLNKNIKIHLFINSGMNREGLQDIRPFIDLVNKSRSVELVGVCSHLASAEEKSDLNQEQLNRFLRAVDKIEESGLKPKWIHLGNSAGVFSLRDKRLTAFRAGISFYGYNVFNRSDKSDRSDRSDRSDKSDDMADSLYKLASQLKPALRVISRVVAIQDLKLGDKVSYNETFMAQKKTRIAIVPFGYYEGLDRRLSNKAEFLVRNKDRRKDFYAKVAGRVCMNLVCLDCGENKVAVGDELEIISAKAAVKNSVQNLADLAGTIPYEILVRLQGNVRRAINI